MFVAEAAVAQTIVSSSTSSTTSYYNLLEVKVGDKAPPMTGISWVQGQEFAFDPGRICVVIVWETRSNSSSRNALPSLIQFWNRYKERSVSVVGLSKDSSAAIGAFLKSHSNTVQFPLAIGAWTVRQEIERTTYSTYYGTYEIGSATLPYAYVVDADGKFAWRGSPLDRNFQTSIDQAIADRDKNYAQRRSADGKTVWTRRDNAGNPTAPGASADKTWQHPVFPWNSNADNNPQLREFLATAANSTDKIGRVTAMGVGSDYGDYKLVLYRDVIVSIEKTFQTLGDNPDTNLLVLQEALANAETGWKRGVLQLVRPPESENPNVVFSSADAMRKLSLSQENNGVSITLTGYWTGLERRFNHATITYEHVARNAALKQIEDEAKPSPVPIKL